MSKDGLSMDEGSRVAVVVPAYRVTGQVLDVVQRMGPEVWRIFVVDDACPDASGDFLMARCQDERVVVLRHETNLGVGAAVVTGYRAALAAGAEVVVKVDGDGQMDPALIATFIAPILRGEADYTKGNRFYELEAARSMPLMRLAGNAGLSFLNKLSSGYWDIFDPTNGFTAIHAEVLRRLPLHKLSRRYFFESDMLFRLSTLRAVVCDVPMEAVYGDEVSHLRVSRVVPEFLLKHMRNFCKRIFYNYWLRDMSLASFELPLGLLFLLGGGGYGLAKWVEYGAKNIPAPTGTVVLPSMLMLMGLQLLLAFVNHDIATVPRRVLHPMLRRTREY